MPLPTPPDQPISRRYTFVVRRPTPGRLLLELAGDPAILPPLLEGTMLAAVLEPRIEDYAPLLVRLPLADPAT